MMTKHEHVIQVSDVPVEKINAPEGSAFGGQRRRVGAQIGARKLGYSFFNVPPGKAAFPYHTHSGNEEMIYVIDGEGILRFGKEEIAVAAGIVIACPPGGDYAHQLINTGQGELHYLVVSTMDYPDLSRVSGFQQSRRLRRPRCRAECRLSRALRPRPECQLLRR